MNVNLKIWRQGSDSDKGILKTYRLENIDPNISFLEMLDILNIKLVKEKKDPVAFDHDCREGICGSCGFMINGRPHGPQKATTVCQLHMRAFNNEDEIKNICTETISKLKAESIKDMGKVMGELKKTNSENIDFSIAGKILKELLNNK